MASDWYRIKNENDVCSPALLLYSERVEENIRRMIAIAGGVERLRPHMKTNKLPEVIRLQMALGITKFKCATIAEAEMTAACGASDVLLAYQPVGPNVKRFVELVRAFPKTKFSVIADDAEVIRELSEAAINTPHPAFGHPLYDSGPLRKQDGPLTPSLSPSEGERVPKAGEGAVQGFKARTDSESPSTIEVLLDIDCGMHRTGVEPGPKAVELYQLIASLPGLAPGGLHVYDGHLHDKDFNERTANCHAAFAPAQALREKLLKANLPVPRVVAGGTPTFPIHAKRTNVECSPGTCVFWDAGYATKLPDMDFLPAALVLTRVVSKPGANRLCLDLGHKAIASENPHPRVQFLNLPDAKAVTHSEEHLVVETSRAAEFAMGDCLYGIPWHICPTVALHSEAVVVENGKAVARWKVAGRERRLTI